MKRIFGALSQEALATAAGLTAVALFAINKSMEEVALVAVFGLTFILAIKNLPGSDADSP